MHMKRPKSAMTIRINRVLEAIGGGRLENFYAFEKQLHINKLNILLLTLWSDIVQKELKNTYFESLLSPKFYFVPIDLNDYLTNHIGVAFSM